MSGRFTVTDHAAVLASGTNGTALVCPEPVALNTEEFTSFFITVPAGEYELVLDTDEAQFGGFGRLKTGERHISLPQKSPNGPWYYDDSLYLYLPARTMLVLRKVG